jgi:hypothetical protein
MNGVLLEPSTTIFQAIIQSRQAAALQEAAEGGEDAASTSNRQDPLFPLEYTQHRLSEF